MRIATMIYIMKKNCTILESLINSSIHIVYKKGVHIGSIQMPCEDEKFTFMVFITQKYTTLTSFGIHDDLIIDAKFAFRHARKVALHYNLPCHMS